MAIRAECPGCKKRYRVPHANKDWQCKVCESVLVLGEEEEAKAEDEPATRDCPECGLINAATAHFCEECGQSLGGGEEQAAERQKHEEKAASAEMKKASVSIRRVLNFLRFALCMHGLRLGGSMLGIINSRASIEFDMANEVLSLVLVGFDVGLLVFVIYQLPRRPFPAALTLAVVSTVSAAFILVSADLPDGGVLILIPFALFWPVVYWIVTMKAAALTRLAKEYPDLFLSRQLHGDKKSATGRSRRRAKQESKPPYIALGVIVLAVMAVGVMGILNSPDSPEPALDSIRQAWNERDFDALAGFVKPSSREKWVKSLETVTRKYEWGEEWPEAGSYEYEVRKETVYVDLQTEAGEVPFRLNWTDDDQWVLSAMSFSDVKDWKAE